MLEVRLALRNLGRHRRRTVLTGVVIAFSVFLFSAFDCFLLGFEQDSLKNQVAHETGELTVHAPGYWGRRQELPLDRTIPAAEELAARLRKVPGVRGATAQLVFPAAVNTGVEELPVKAVGTDPLSDGAVLRLREAVKVGRYLEPGRDEALLGRELARLMDLAVGDTFTLVVRGERSTFEALDLEVVGLLGSNNPALNEGVYVPLSVAQAATGLPGAATHLLLAGGAGYARLGGLPGRVKAEVARVGPDLEVKTWQDWADDYLHHAKADRQNMNVILGLVAVLAALGVVNSVLLSGMERRREIGTLKALGLTEGRITLLFMLEGMGIGLFGGLAGAVLGAGAVAYLTLVGVDFSRFSGLDFGFAVEGLFRGSWNWPSLVAAWVAGALASFLVSYWPARRSARPDPAVVLRG